jgi:hypothetical protein
VSHSYYSLYSEDFSDPDNCVASYDQIKLLEKSAYSEGFEVHEIQPFDENIVSFVDDTRKLVIDNTGAYGHFMANWMYVLVRSIESGEPLTIVFYSKDKHPQQIKNGLVSVTKYLDKELTRRGHRVEYAETDKFYINNFIHVKTPFGIPVHDLKPVSDFLVENLSPQVPTATKKIYLSRRKVTYSFLDRIDDEEGLEEYVKTLGFEVVYPEDFDSYHEQLDKISEAKVLMSLTSSGLSASLVLAPETWVVELSSFMHVKSGDPALENGYDIRYSSFHDHYRVMSTVRNGLYLSISNREARLDKVVQHIESSGSLKSLLLS